MVAPATPQDARDMLLAALREPDPVVVFEHVLLYGLEGELDEQAAPGPLRGAAVRRPGRDVTRAFFGRWGLHPSP